MNLTPTGFAVIVLFLILLAIGVAVAENIRVRRENAAPASEDDRLARDVARYHCAAHGHYYGAHPEVYVDCDVWTCKTCGHEAPGMHGGRKPFDQASA